jgi:hypothetical protein
VLYWASFFDLVEVGGANFCFPCRGQSGSVDVLHRLQYVAEVVQRRWLMRQFPWSYASATCGGRRASSLLAVNQRRDGWKRRPVIGQRALGLCCAIPNMSRVFSVKV